MLSTHRKCGAGKGKELAVQTVILQALRTCARGLRFTHEMTDLHGACRGSLRRLGLEQIALGQLHWSVAKYAPPLECVLWEGLAGMYEQVLFHTLPMCAWASFCMSHLVISACLHHISRVCCAEAAVRLTTMDTF